jgi:hypothetical protein
MLRVVADENTRAELTQSGGPGPNRTRAVGVG